jgi:hypothetical protein
MLTVQPCVRSQVSVYCCLASQGIVHSLWNSHFHYRAQTDLPLVPVLSSINPVHNSHSIFKGGF